MDMETLEETLAGERAMLVRYCARVVGDACAAEDLAHQTLLEAWRKEDQLYDQQVRPYWLLGMARNVCLRWMRRRGLDAARLVRLPEPLAAVNELPSTGYDIDKELERDDLARLLDRALALLPPETRQVLVQKYVDELPQAEVAARLGLTEGAIEARLQRGKLTLRRILMIDLSEEARAYGIISSDGEGWQQTRIWCSDCGVRRLLGRFADGHDLHLDCPSCHGGARSVVVRSRAAELLWGGTTSEQLFAGIKGYKPALNRLQAGLHESYRRGIAGRSARCSGCGRQAPLRVSPCGASGETEGDRDVQTACPRCGAVNGIGTVGAVALATPAGRAFWREHGRIRTLPGRIVDAGVPAIVTRFESVTGNATLEIVLARDTLDPIGVRGAPGE